MRNLAIFQLQNLADSSALVSIGRCGQIPAGRDATGITIAAPLHFDGLSGSRGSLNGPYCFLGDLLSKESHLTGQQVLGLFQST
jgi:hypothetical protein